MMDKLVGMVVGKLFDMLAPKLVDAVGSAFEEWMPKMVKAVVLAVGESISDTTDKVTDMIPGKWDDQIVDAIVNNTLDWIRNWEKD